MDETKTRAELLKELGTDKKEGLTSDEAVRRLAADGPNKLAEKKRKSIFLAFLSQLNDPMIWILFAAALVSLITSIVKGTEFADVIIILIVVIVNATIGTVQERKAENALKALKKLAAPEALVKRDGKLVKIKAEDLVRGDILVIEEGDTIGADVRLLETHNFKVDESSLTGESVPVEKNAAFTITGDVPLGDRLNSAFMSTPCVYGRGEGVVVATGMKTEIGKIAGMLSGKEEKTPLQKRLADLSKLLGILTIVIVAAILIVGLIQKRDFVDMLLTSISLAVAAVPEGLPAVVTIVLAIGVQRMVKANAIVRRLPSVETLGAVNYVCSDKTGTLTQNQMTVTAAYVDKKEMRGRELKEPDVSRLAALMALASNGTIENGVHGDPTEIALLHFADSLGFAKSSLEELAPRVDEYPFDSNRKMMSVSVTWEDRPYLLTKGAIDSVLAHSTSILENGEVHPLSDEDRERVSLAAARMSSEALRVLAAAYRPGEGLKEDELVFLGLAGMSDPARPEAAAAVKEFKRAGIVPVMITGDHRETAFAIAKELGIASAPSECVTGVELDAMSPTEIQETVKTARVYARVSPANKVAIVKAIKANGNIAAMTGDGVNDAPSLKAADIGIAMGVVGTDVAKEAADMVLTDDNFASIEKAVEEGRGIYANIKKTVMFLLSSNIGEVLLMFVAIALSLPLPLVAIQILWVNLVTDSLPAIALGSDRKPDNIMASKPRGARESLFAKGGYAIMFGYGALIGLLALLAFLAFPMRACVEGGLPVTLDNLIMLLKAPDRTLLSMAETACFIVLSLSELFHMLGMRNLRKSVFVTMFKKFNWVVLVAFVAGFFLQVAVIGIPGLNDFFHCVSLPAVDWVWLVLLAMAPMFVHELVALCIWLDGIRRKRSRKGKPSA